MGILRTDRVSGLGGANAIKGSVFFGNCHSSGSALGNDYLITERSSNFTFGTGDITIEGWFFCPRLSSSTGYQSLVGDTVYYNGDASINGFTFYIENAQLNFWSDVSNSVVSGGTIPENQWNHLAYTRESGSNKIFINGSLVGTASDSTDYTDTALTIGTNKVTQTSGSDAGQYSFSGFASNVRVLKGRALYTAAFTPPVGELQVIDNTVLLCCQSPGNVLQEATGVILTAPRISNSAGAQASHFTPNSPVGFSTTTDVGTQFGTTFDGVTTFDSQAHMVVPGGNTRERNRGRGVIGWGGNPVSPAIDFINIQSQGNAIRWGTTITSSWGAHGCSSSTRGLFGAGYLNDPNTFYNNIEFLTIANEGKVIDFGNLSAQAYKVGALSNQTRGIFALGYAAPNFALTNVIDFVTIATAGDASNFGDITPSSGRAAMAACSSTTRGLFAGGQTPSTSDIIDFITIATTGNAADFGNLTQARDNVAGASSNTRAVFGGGSSPTIRDTIDFVTMASAGNATDFGNLVSAQKSLAGTSDNTRGVFAGGYISPATVNVMNFITIATAGNALDFGDLSTARRDLAGFSDSHGGLE